MPGADELRHAQGVVMVVPGAAEVVPAGGADASIWFDTTLLLSCWLTLLRSLDTSPLGAVLALTLF